MDFDGIFTDNHVYLDQNGMEQAKCSRSDGYGIELLHKAKKKKIIDFDYFVLSSEQNPIVEKRCSKLRIPCHFGVKNKWEFLQEWTAINRKTLKNPFEEILYLGNDLNDLEVIMNVGNSIIPIDSHPLLSQFATLQLDIAGGSHFVRHVVEILLNLEDYSNDELLEIIK